MATRSFGFVMIYKRFKMDCELIYLFPPCFCLLCVCIHSDAMAYRGDLIGCTIKFEGITNGQVPVVFTLNGRRITQDEIWIDYTPGGKLMYPYIAMGHQGIRVLAKVCTINYVKYAQFI